MSIESFAVYRVAVSFNQRIMSSNCFLPIKPVIMQLSADPSFFLSRRDRISPEILGVAAVAETMITTSTVQPE